MTTEILEYEGTSIALTLGENVMVNATDMAKPFGKKPNDWLRLPSTETFLEELQKVRLSRSLIETSQGRGGGTWFHEDVAMEFARWLDPKFAIWCNDRIKELLKTGITTIANIEDMIANPDVAIELLNNLKVERTKRALAEQQVVLYQPKAEAYDEWMDSTGMIITSSVAALLNTEASRLNYFLNDIHVIKKEGNTWHLTKEYKGKDYGEMRPWEKKEVDKSGLTLKWYPKGVELIKAKVKEHPELFELRKNGPLKRIQDEEETKQRTIVFLLITNPEFAEKYIDNINIKDFPGKYHPLLDTIISMYNDSGTLINYKILNTLIRFRYPDAEEHAKISKTLEEVMTSYKVKDKLVVGMMKKLYPQPN